MKNFLIKLTTSKNKYKKNNWYKAVICVLVLVSLFIFSFSDSFAEQVKLNMAKKVAETYLSYQSTERLLKQTLSTRISDIKEIKKDNGKMIAYLIELEPEGFMILSGDTDIRPVLGYSFNGKFPFQESPQNVLLHLIKWDMEARLKNLASAEPEIENLAKSNNELWNKYVSGDLSFLKPIGEFDIWGPWLQTEWHQSGHWNNKCPYIVPHVPGFRRPVGCVATAMAQIVNYWQYPKSVWFSDKEYFYISGTEYSCQESNNYGFPSLADMRTNLSSLFYDGNEDEEAYLSFAAGVKLHMNYGVLGSGANTYSVREVLNDHFGFGSVIADTYRSGVWFLHSLEIVEDLKNGWPVQIAIHKSGKTGGHSIVFDGYQDDGEYFHLNYGWGANSPDAIGNAWYNIPTDMPNYDVVHTVVYGIAKYQGWNQIGADQRNSYHAIYPSPISQPERKWSVNIPEGLPTSTSYSFSHLVIGTGGRIYTALSPSDLGSIYHPYIAIYDKYGTIEKLIEVTHSNVKIRHLCQNSRGEIFFSSGTGGPSATDSKLYLLNPETDDITAIFSHKSPDSGIFETPIKVDRDDYLYFIIEPRNVANYAKFYCVNRTGTNRWEPISFPSSAQFFTTQPAIDEERDRVYLNYFEKTDGYKGVSHLIAFRLTNGALVFDKELPTPIHFSSFMARAPAVSEDGTVYVGAYTSLFAYSSDGAQLWEKSFRLTSQTLAIGSDGTLYVIYGKIVNDNWRPGYVRALDPSNGNTKWEKSLSLGEDDRMVEIYAAANGMVIYSYVKDGVNRLGGIKEEGTSYGNGWDVEGGGTLAFGPNRTIVSISPGHENSIWTLTDYGTRGEPEGMGMNYADNSQPIIPSIISPSDGADNLDNVNVQLSWACSDPDGHDLKYDIFACALVEGEEAAFVPVASQITGNSYTLTLQAGTQYLWSVVATDGQATTESPTWAFHISPDAVPVELSSFTAKIDINEGVVLNWITLSETNNYGFYIERSIDKMNFRDIGFVKGSGNSVNKKIYSFKDNDDNVSGTYYYRLKQIDFDGSYNFSDIINVEINVPKEFSLHQNYPNPFNPETTIKYQIPKTTNVILKIYNIISQEVKTLVNEEKQPGNYQITWDSTNNYNISVSSGVYIYQIRAGNFIQTKKMILLR